MNSHLTTSFGIPYYPENVFCPTSITEIVDYYKSIDQSQRLIILGSGTNTIISDQLKNFNVLLIQNKELEVEEFENTVRVKAGAGIIFDELVERAVCNNWSGLEALSAIPGTVGASPIQNIGAYGTEVSSIIESVEVFDKEINSIKNIPKEECDFGYRKSRFNTYDKGRSIVLSVTFLLHKNLPVQIPRYPGVAEYMIEQTIEHPTLSDIRNCITSLRWSKLPNPAVLGNTGSFFKNILTDEYTFKKILAEFPDLPQFPSVDGMHKIPTGWLLEKAGLKGKSIGNICFYEKNALVVTNKDNALFADVLYAVDTASKLVYEKFNISLEVEPEFIY